MSINLSNFHWEQYTTNQPPEANVTGDTSFDTGVGHLAFKMVNASGNLSSTDNPMVPGSNGYNLIIRPCFGTKSVTGAVTVSNVTYWMFENSSGQDGALSVATNRSRVNGDSNWGWDTNNITFKAHLFPASGSMGTAWNTTTTPPTGETGMHTYTWGTGAWSFQDQGTGAPTNASTMSGITTYEASALGSTYYPFGDFVVLNMKLGSNYPLGPGGESLLCMQYDITA